MTVDAIGATEVPLVAPNSDQAVGDPLLTYLLSFFKAIANTYCKDAWAVAQPGGNASVPVAFTFAHDPRKFDAWFIENQLPALFLFRVGQDKRSDISADIQNHYGKLALFWVPHFVQGKQRASREPFFVGLFRALSIALEMGRDPAWYVPQDDYPQNANTGDVEADRATNQANTQQRGSVLAHFAKFARLSVDSWAPAIIEIQIEGAPLRKYEAYMATLPIQEWLTHGTDRFDELAGLSQKINVPADDELPAETIVEQTVT